VDVFRVGLACAILVALGAPAAPVAGESGAGHGFVTVRIGAPSEFTVTLSRTSALPRQVTFVVTNHGALSHAFKVCTVPVSVASLTSCAGKRTAVLGPGQTRLLTVTFSRPGGYEYLSGIPGHAAYGMKGLLAAGARASQLESLADYHDA
jgi:hypothetical protein